MITWIRALFVARRLELRDKGKVEAEWITTKDGHIYRRTLVHPTCNARVRIGIKDGRTVRWCWRCEQILSDSFIHSEPPPGAEQDDEEGKRNKVIPLFGGRSP